mmetsp:Transcript_40742/g.117004  ORF Transcript_40742/g.117004 Transcript_40742/m.117004 type:complete len:205 (+) Transcript_40742:1299-1913(+)
MAPQQYVLVSCSSYLTEHWRMLSQNSYSMKTRISLKCLPPSHQKTAFRNQRSPAVMETFQAAEVCVGSRDCCLCPDWAADCCCYCCYCSYRQGASGGQRAVQLSQDPQAVPGKVDYLLPHCYYCSFVCQGMTLAVGTCFASQDYVVRRSFQSDRHFDPYCFCRFRNSSVFYYWMPAAAVGVMKRCYCCCLLDYFETLCCSWYFR